MPLGSNKSAPHKKGAQHLKRVHDRDNGGNLHTPYSGRSKREKTRTIPTSKALEGAENYMVVCAEGEKMAKGMDTNPGDHRKGNAPNDHAQVVPEGNIPNSGGTDNSEGRFDIDPRLGEVERDVGPVDELEEVCIDEEDTTKVIKIGKNLEAAIRARLVEFLRKNSDVFAWSHKDMVGISPNVISHVLNIDKDHPPVRQKRRLLDKERSKAFKEEVERLKENGFIRETYYPAWVSNPVLVPKSTLR